MGDEHLITKKPRVFWKDWLAIQWFAAQCFRKLRKNKYKAHWDYMALSTCKKRLKEELVELDEAYQKGDWDEVIKESADVTNFAMMLAYKANILHKQKMSIIQKKNSQLCIEKLKQLWRSELVVSYDRSTKKNSIFWKKRSK